MVLPKSPRANWWAPDGTQAPDKTCYRIEKIKVTSLDTLTIEMAAGGGQAITFIP